MQLSDTRFGIITWADPRTPVREIGDVAREAEAMGFSTLWVWDTPIYTKDAYVALTVAAQATEKIRLGPGVSNPLTRHASVIANGIATLDDLSDGRDSIGDGEGGAGFGERSRVSDGVDGTVQGEAAGFAGPGIGGRGQGWGVGWIPGACGRASNPDISLGVGAEDDRDGGRASRGSALLRGRRIRRLWLSKIRRLRSAAKEAGRGTGEVGGATFS